MEKYVMDGTLTPLYVIDVSIHAQLKHNASEWTTKIESKLKNIQN